MSAAATAAPPDGAAAQGPGGAGIGLRHAHIHDFLERPRAVGWVEVHSENYLAPGGPRLEELERIRAEVPVSCHGVGLSLGSAGGLDAAHLADLRAFITRYEPALVSEHLAWSTSDGIFLNDLLPLPYTEEALAVVGANIAHAQERLQRALLIENPSRYLRFVDSVIPEVEFLIELSARTGCGILLDVNNLYVSAANVGEDAARYLAALPPVAIGEIHVAGHSTHRRDGRTILLDDHASRVAPAVWELLSQAFDRLGPRPVLVEWDLDLPPFSVLLDEAAHADGLLAAEAGERTPAVA